MRGKIGRILLSITAFGFCALFLPALVARHAEPLLPNRLSPSPASTLYDSIRTDLSDYSWPTDARRAITSTFGEYRRTHFHGGIDISTGNRTGYHVYAARDGYVSRIRVSPTGYGKMLYVRHADGFYTTYAHLQKFNAEIDARAASEQKKLGRYPIDIECTPSEFPVNKGDIIAYTGDTGVGTPHLHFEIRDQNRNLVNPFLCKGLRTDDDIVPTIRRIAVTPLGQASVVNGNTRPCVYRARPVRNGVYRIPEILQLTGEVGFAIDVRDRSNGTWFKHGVYQHEFFIDDSLLYSVRLDRVPGNDAHQIGLYYDWNLLDQGRGRFEKLYMNSPNTLPFYEPKGSRSGIINTTSFTEGPHTFKIVSSDFNNQSSVVTGKVVLNHPPTFGIERTNTNLLLNFPDMGTIPKIRVYTKRNESEGWDLKVIPINASTTEKTLQIPIMPGKYDIMKLVAENSWGTQSYPRFIVLEKPNVAGGMLHLEHEVKADFVLVTLSTTRLLTAPPSLHVYEGNSKRTIPLIPGNDYLYGGSFIPLETFQGVRRLVVEAEVAGIAKTANDEFELHPIAAATSGRITIDSGNLELLYDSLSVFKTVFLQIEKGSSNGQLSYALYPENTVLNKGFTAIVRTAPTQSRLGLFFRGEGTFDLLATTEKSAGEVLKGRVTRTLGELSVLADDTPPVTSAIKIARTSGGRPSIAFKVSDNLSGVEYNELKMYIDGAIVIPEIDGEHRRVLYQVTDPLERGSHQLTIHVQDRMGNSREVVQRFSVR